VTIRIESGSSSGLSRASIILDEIIQTSIKSSNILEGCWVKYSLNVPFGFFGGTTLSDPFFKGTTSTGV